MKTSILFRMTLIFLYTSLPSSASQPQIPQAADEWAHIAGGVDHDYGYAIDMDAAGNLYATGSFEHEVSFGETTLNSQGAKDIFVCALNEQGNILWAKSAGGAENDAGNGITAVSNNTIGLTGYFEETAVFNELTVTGEAHKDIFTSMLGFKTNVSPFEVPYSREQDFFLSQNYPNPFNPQTTISYTVKDQCHVSLIVYDIRGREVMRLVDETKIPGYYQTTFDAGRLASGMYLYRIQMKDFVKVKKMVLLE